MAAANGRLSTVALLVSFGAFVNCQDNEGDTPLHYAVREGHLQLVEQLVTRCNACVDIPNEDQDTALELASCLGMNDYVQFLARFSKGSAMETSAEISGYSW
jgi:ankyrin repeat protein